MRGDDKDDASRQGGREPRSRSRQWARTGPAILLLDRGRGRGRRRLVFRQRRCFKVSAEDVLESVAEAVEETTVRAAGDGASNGNAFLRPRGSGHKVAVGVTNNLNARSTSNAFDAAAGYGHRATRQGHRMAWVTIGDGDGACLVGCHRQPGRRIWYVELNLTIGYDRGGTRCAGHWACRRIAALGRRWWVRGGHWASRRVAAMDNRRACRWWVRGGHWTSRRGAATDNGPAGASASHLDFASILFPWLAEMPGLGS